MRSESERDTERLALDLFLDARDLPPEDRASFLERACGGRDDLRRRVDLLLDADKGSLALSEIAETGVLSVLRLDDSTAPAFPPGLAGGSEAQGPARYQIVGKLGEGGMGVVHLAYSPELRRHVALKVMKGNDQELGQRFLREAQVLAQLQHPNIVPLLDFGLTAARESYYTMPVLRGRTLRDILRDRARGEAEALHRYTLTRLLQIHLQVVEAVAYAHSKGVIHRDLKPANVMLGEHGEVQLLDWGLSKVLARPEGARTEPAISELQEEDPGLTRHGALAGTLAYMSPEQARGDVGVVGEATDVYALGAILYEILAGRPPVEGKHVPELRRQVIEGSIVWPSEAAPDRNIPRELDAVVRRAMASDPEDRYPGPAALAADISAYLEGRILRGIGYGLLDPVWKWVKRNRTLSFSVAAATLVLLAVVAVFVWNLTAERKRALDAESAAVSERRKAEESLARSRYSEAVALAESGRTHESADVLSALERSAVAALPPMAMEAMRWTLAQSGHGMELLAFGGGKDAVNSIAFLPDGRRAVSAGADGVLRLWDVQTGTLLRGMGGGGEPLVQLAITLEGERALVGGESGTLRLWDLHTGAEIWRRDPPAGHRELSCISITPDSSRVLAVFGTPDVYLLDLTTGETAGTLRGASVNPHSVSVSPDGRFAVTGQFTKHRDRNVGRICLWDLRAERFLECRNAHGDVVRFVGFSPDGKILFTGAEDTQLASWSLRDGTLLRRFVGHTRGIKAGAVSPDGRHLLSGSFDRTMRLWDTDTGREVRRFSGHGAQVNGVAFSPDGRFALSASWDGTIRLWSLDAEELVRTFDAGQAMVGHFTLSEDGRRALCGLRTGASILLDIETGKCLARFPGRGFPLWAVALSPDGRLAFQGGEDGSLEIVDLLGERSPRTWRAHQGSVARIRASDDGTELWSFGRDGKRKCWNLATGQLVGQEAVPLGPETKCTFSPDWRFALLSSRGTLELRNVESGTTDWVIKTAPDAISCVCFSPDGRWALGGSDVRGRLLKISIRTGEKLWDRVNPGWSLGPFGVSSDGRTAVVLTSSGPGLYDLRTGDAIRVFPTDMVHMSTGAVLPDSRSFLLAGLRVELWDIGAPERLAPWRARLERSPETPESWNAFGEYYASRGLHDWALEFLARAREAGYPVRSETLAKVLWQLDRPAEAAGMFERALETATKRDRIHLTLCLLAARREADAKHRPSGR